MPVPDAVVIGSGPNGLVAANHLVDAGWSVHVLEASAQPGGAVRTGELTLPGFRHDLYSAFYPLAAASGAISQLHLEEYGLVWKRAPLVLAHPLPDGRCAALSMDLEETAASLEAFAPGDGDRWRAMIAEWDAISEPLLGAVLGPFPPARAAATLAGRLGPLGIARLARQALLPVRRMGEELFAGEGGPLLLGGSALHTDLTPEGAASGIYGWLLCCLGQRVGFPVPEGGAGALTDALVARLRSKGGELTCATRVEQIVVRRGRAVAVRTMHGEIGARRAVVADVSAPALYAKLIAAEHLPASVLADIRRFQWDCSTVKVDFALDAPIAWSASDARRAGTLHIADDFDNLTEHAADLAMGRLPARPFLLFGQQSMTDPTRAPVGSETAWAYTRVPRTIRADGRGELDVTGDGADRVGEIARDGASEPWLDGFVERIEQRIEALAPGFRSTILARHVFSPASLQDGNANLVGGALGGGTALPHQQLVFRPIPGFGRAETPITALYLASASAHPGPGVHGAAGANAARAALAPWRHARSIAFGRGPLRRAHMRR